MAKLQGQSCSWAGCGRASKAQLAERVFCLEHFLEISHSRINSLQKSLLGNGGDRGTVPGAQEFLSQLIWQTTLLATEMRLLHPQVREDLLSLSTLAAELYKKISRAPRIKRRVNCRLRADMEMPESWEECVTLNISQRGACVEVRTPLRLNWAVTFEREDTRECARARVAWSEQTGPGKYLAGLDIFDQDDFWGLNVAHVNAEESTKASGA